MDPVVKAFLDKLEVSLEVSTAAQRTTAAKIDELIAWTPDLERRVADLGDAVAALQLAQPPQRKEGEFPWRASSPPRRQRCTVPLMELWQARLGLLTGRLTTAMHIYNGSCRWRPS